jgi:hypothetical protein
MTLGVCECGCGQRTRIAKQNNAAKGWVIGRPFRYVVGHSRKHWFRWSVQGECWVWEGATTGPDGYAIWRFPEWLDDELGGKLVPVHRLMLWLEGELPVFSGGASTVTHASHGCSRKACINPDHVNDRCRYINMAHGAIVTHFVRRGIDPPSELIERLLLELIDAVNEGLLVEAPDQDDEED